LSIQSILLELQWWPKINFEIERNWVKAPNSTVEIMKNSTGKMTKFVCGWWIGIHRVELSYINLIQCFIGNHRKNFEIGCFWKFWKIDKIGEIDNFSVPWC
jgi:hypothetical protein